MKSELEEMAGMQQETMKPLNTGGPAFPLFHGEGGGGEQGMTLRQWYAGIALQGLIASRPKDLAPNVHATYAEVAFLLADAMIAAGTV